MARSDPSAVGDSPAAQEDRIYRQAVLSLILDLHPCQLSYAELCREVSAGAQFDQTDPVSRALDFLVRTGLLRREGESVLPTRAALVFNELEFQ